MEEPDDALRAYVRATAQQQRMPLPAEREAAILAVVARLGEFAAELAAFPIADHDEPAGSFVP